MGHRECAFDKYKNQTHGTSSVLLKTSVRVDDDACFIYGHSFSTFPAASTEPMNECSQ